MQSARRSRRDLTVGFDGKQLGACGERAGVAVQAPWRKSWKGGLGENHGHSGWHVEILLLWPGRGAHF